MSDEKQDTRTRVEKLEDSGKQVAGTFRDFMVDLMGCLVPGLFFSLICAVALVLNYRTVISYLPGSGYVLLSDISSLMTQYSLEFLVFVVSFAYILGSVFFRKDPKEPDTASCKYLLKKENKKRAKKQQTSEKPSLDSVSAKYDFAFSVNGDGSLQNCEYPYLRMSEYLSDRGLPHLNKYVTWSTENSQHRTKMAINILKLRILRTNSRLYQEVIRNEAHIRLMSSLWYAIKWQLVTLGISALIGAIFFGICYFQVDPTWNSVRGNAVTSVFFSSGFLLLSFAVRRSITKFFHYQRVREVVYVLEIADELKIGVPC